MSRRTANTGAPDWITPPEIIEPVREALGGIELDPCSSSRAQTIVGATVYYSIAERLGDGLSESWCPAALGPRTGGGVWVNPPGADERTERGTHVPALWWARAVAAYVGGECSRLAFLIYALGSLRHMAKLAPTVPHPCDYRVVWLRRRISFLDPVTLRPGGAPRYDSAIVLLGPVDDRPLRELGYVTRGQAP